MDGVYQEKCSAKTASNARSLLQADADLVWHVLQKLGGVIPIHPHIDMWRRIILERLSFHQKELIDRMRFASRSRENWTRLLRPLKTLGRNRLETILNSLVRESCIRFETTEVGVLAIEQNAQDGYPSPEQ